MDSEKQKEWIAELMKNAYQYDGYFKLCGSEGEFPESDSTRFKWNMYAFLPYSFPSNKPVEIERSFVTRKYKLLINNDLELSMTSRKYIFPPLPVVVPRKQSAVGSAPGLRQGSSKTLVCFEELAEYKSPKDALVDEDTKIHDCFEMLSDFLVRCQRNAPYLSTWLIYPVSLPDSGTFYQLVSDFDTEKNKWTPFTSVVCATQFHNISAPPFELDDLDGTLENSVIDTPNELLAEAQMALVRGTPRQTVWNSYSAVELLATLIIEKQIDLFEVQVTCPHFLYQGL